MQRFFFFHTLITFIGFGGSLPISNNRRKAYIMDGLKNDQGAAPVNAGTDQNADTNAELKYTDADVDNIIKRKLARERSRYEGAKASENRITELDKREREILTRELSIDCKERLRAANLPEELSTVMNYSSYEAYDKSYTAITEIVSSITKPLHDEITKLKARGTTPRNYSNSDIPTGDEIAKAFGVSK